MIHPITDFKALFPEAFNTLIKDHMEGLEKFRYGSFVCPECDVINPVYYNSPHESYKPFKDSNGDVRQLHCESCGYKEPRNPFNECFVCDKPYRGKRYSKYCSRACQSEMTKTGENVPCDVCKKTFYKRNYELNRTRHNYCSQDCYKTLRPKKEIGYTKLPCEFKAGDIVKHRSGAYRILAIYKKTPENSNVTVPKLKIRISNGHSKYWVRYRLDSKKRVEILNGK